jgi:NAD-specific glutamate dehydrogenase
LVQNLFIRIDKIERDSRLLFINKPVQKSGNNQREKFLKNLSKNMPDSEYLTVDELGFFTEQINKAYILSEFNPKLANEIIETVQMDKLVEAFHLKIAHNYIPD